MYRCDGDDMVSGVCTGVMGMIWSVVWWLCSWESPAKHPYISEEEKVYIQSSIGENVAIVHRVSARHVRLSTPSSARLLLFLLLLLSFFLFCFVVVVFLLLFSFFPSVFENFSDTCFDYSCTILRSCISISPVV